jgi:hypothetical protein
LISKKGFVSRKYEFKNYKNKKREEEEEEEEDPSIISPSE